MDIFAASFNIHGLHLPLSVHMFNKTPTKFSSSSLLLLLCLQNPQKSELYSTKYTPPKYTFSCCYSLHQLVIVFHYSPKHAVENNEEKSEIIAMFDHAIFFLAIQQIKNFCHIQQMLSTDIPDTPQFRGDSPLRRIQ